MIESDKNTSLILAFIFSSSINYSTQDTNSHEWMKLTLPDVRHEYVVTKMFLTYSDVITKRFTLQGVFQNIEFF